mgnify:CR=1 FL=1
MPNNPWPVNETFKFTMWMESQNVSQPDNSDVFLWGEVRGLSERGKTETVVFGEMLLCESPTELWTVQAKTNHPTQGKLFLFSLQEDKSRPSQSELSLCFLPSRYCSKELVQERAFSGVARAIRSKRLQSEQTSRLARMADYEFETPGLLQEGFVHRRGEEVHVMWQPKRAGFGSLSQKWQQIRQPTREPPNTVCQLSQNLRLRSSPLAQIEMRVSS